MKIVHVLTRVEGGGGVHAAALAHAAARRGDTVSFIAPERVDPSFDWVPLALRQAPRIWASLRRADLVHYHGVRAGLMGLVSYRRRSMLTTHALHALRRTAGWRRALAGLLTRLVARLADLVVTVSEAEKRDLERLDPTLADRIEVVLNGVKPAPLPTPDQRKAARERFRLADGDKVVLFVGALIDQKQPELALEAARLAKREVPELALLVAGSGPRVPDIAPAETSWLRLLGQRSDVEELYAAADIVLNTSRWEGLSMALLEALWRGRPIVASDAPGNSEAVGDAGVIVGNGAQQLADAIRDLLASDERRDVLSARARARAERLFDEESMVDATLRLYDRLCPRE